MAKIEKIRYADKKQGHFYYDNEKQCTTTKSKYEESANQNLVRFCIFCGIIVVGLIIYFFTI